MLKHIALDINRKIYGVYGQELKPAICFLYCNKFSIPSDYKRYDSKFEYFETFEDAFDYYKAHIAHPLFHASFDLNFDIGYNLRILTVWYDYRDLL